MSELSFVDNSNFEKDALHEAIKSYKDAMRAPDKDLDVDYLLKTFEYVNDISPIKVARNPIDKDRAWVHDTQLRNVKEFDVDDEGRLVIRTRGDKTEFLVEKALEQIEQLKNRHKNITGAIVLERANKEPVVITDVYSHAFASKIYAGLPFELVLAYFVEDE